MPPKPHFLLLPLIVFSQFAGTSLWFAVNAVLIHIQPESGSGIANNTSIVQFGFIAGTLIFSILNIADRFPAARVFFISALLASLANLLVIFLGTDLTWLYVLRFITGFFLAGIYPVGMKIAADLFPEKLGHALGYLVGALVLGTAFPFLVKSGLQDVHWKKVLIFTSALAFSGGLLMLLFAKAKHLTIKKEINYRAALQVFRSRAFKGAAYGYFGHMWELYAFWAFVPMVIEFYNRTNAVELPVAMFSFLVIAAGTLGCIIGGWFSKKHKSRKVAFIALLISGGCCLIAPFLFYFPPVLFLFFLFIWGITVVTDSPQFSTLVAQAATSENKGTALTIVTSIGFTITIISIQLLKLATSQLQQYGFLILLPGPVLGLIAMKKYLPRKGAGR